MMSNALTTIKGTRKFCRTDAVDCAGIVDAGGGADLGVGRRQQWCAADQWTVDTNVGRTVNPGPATSEKRQKR